MKYIAKFCRHCHKEVIIPYDLIVFDEKTKKQVFKHLIEKSVICEECKLSRYYECHKKF